MKTIGILILSFFTANYANAAWEAKVTNILQHGNWVAVTLSPDPGKGNCEAGSPYLIEVDGTPANNQLFSMMLTALTTGKKVMGYNDPCVTAIWGKSRPTIKRLNLNEKQATESNSNS